MAYRRKTPFTFNFSCPEGETTIGPKRIVNASAIISLSAYVEDDEKGPVLLDIYVVIDEVKYPIIQESISDLGGSNAVRIQWKGYQPLSYVDTNLLYIVATNWCGESIDAIRINGVVER